MPYQSSHLFAVQVHPRVIYAKPYSTDAWLFIDSQAAHL
jgi:hypothetical protein